MKFLTTEEGRVAGLSGINIASAAAQPWIVPTESVMRLLLLVGQIAVAYLTAWYIYQKIRKSTKVDDE